MIIALIAAGLLAPSVNAAPLELSAGLTKLVGVANAACARDLMATPLSNTQMIGEAEPKGMVHESIDEAAVAQGWTSDEHQIAVAICRGYFQGYRDAEADNTPESK